MFEEDSEEFNQRLGGFVIPKKKVEPKTETDDSIKNDDGGATASNSKNYDKIKESEKVKADGDNVKVVTKSPVKRVSRRSAADFLDSGDMSLPPAFGSKDPLGLEHVPTYGEVRGTLNTFPKVWLSQYEEPLPDEISKQCMNERCGLCGVEFSSQSVARCHYSGRPHAKRSTAVLEKWVSEDPSNRRMPTLKPLNVPNDNSQSFYENREDHDETYCQLCRIELTSKIVATMHYQGKNHAKMLRKREAGIDLNPEWMPPPQKQARQMLEEGELEDDKESRQGSGNRFFCMCCKLHFSSQDRYRCHLLSQEHRSKANNSDGGDVVPTFTKVATSDSIDQMLSKLRNNPKSMFDCSLCQVQCNSQDVLNTHLQGKQHAKKLVLSQHQTQNGPSQFRCEICNIETTDQNGLEMHLAGKKHLKKAGRNT